MHFHSVTRLYSFLLAQKPTPLEYKGQILVRLKKNTERYRCIGRSSVLTLAHVLAKAEPDRAISNGFLDTLSLLHLNFQLELTYHLSQGRTSSGRKTNLGLSRPKSTVLTYKPQKRMAISLQQCFFRVLVILVLSNMPVSIIKLLRADWIIKLESGYSNITIFYFSMSLQSSNIYGPKHKHQNPTQSTNTQLFWEFSNSHAATLQQSKAVRPQIPEFKLNHVAPGHVELEKNSFFVLVHIHVYVSVLWKKREHLVI